MIAAKGLSYTTPSGARAVKIRRIVADVCERSFGGTREGLRFRADLDIRGSQEDEISWRIMNELGVAIPKIEWSDFSTLGNLIEFVEMQTQATAAASE